MTSTPEHRAPEGGRPVSEMCERIAIALYGLNYEPHDWVAESEGLRVIYRRRALAAMNALHEPTEECRRSSELGAKVRRVAAQLSSERFNGWANPLVADLVDAADFLEGKKPIQDSSGAAPSPSGARMASEKRAFALVSPAGDVEIGSIRSDERDVWSYAKDDYFVNLDASLTLGWSILPVIIRLEEQDNG